MQSVRPRAIVVEANLTAPKSQDFGGFEGPTQTCRKKRIHTAPLMQVLARLALYLPLNSL